MKMPEKTPEEYEKWIAHFQKRIEDLESQLEFTWKNPGLEDYQEKTILAIRAKKPMESSKYTDRQLVQVYREYCEENYAAGWTEVDLDHFAKAAFGGLCAE